MTTKIQSVTGWFESLPVSTQSQIADRFTVATGDNTDLMAGLTEFSINWLAANYPEAYTMPEAFKVMWNELEAELTPLIREREVLRTRILDKVFSYLERKAESVEHLYDMDKDEDEQVRAVSLPWFKG